MDKEQARFILAGYRPDGADADAPDFAAALALAASDRELAGWLANERAFDADFAHALSVVSIPAGLREEILAGLAASRGDMPQANSHEDAAMIGAISSLHPPEHLRAHILAAMQATNVREFPSPSARGNRWKRFVWPLSAAAAGVAFALFFTKEKIPAPIAAISLPRVEAGFVNAVSAPDFRLDEKKGDSLALIAELKSRGLPCPCCLPKGLATAQAIGCREMDIDGKNGSVICFVLKDGSLVHLLSFRREDISCRLRPHDQPKFVRNGNWSIAKWATDERVFMLMGEMESEQLVGVF